MKTIVCLLCLLLICNILYAKIERENIEVTIYNEDFALIKETRMVDLKEGINHIRLTDIPAQIDATSVRFLSLNDPQGTFVKEQNYEYDLASDAKLLHKYLDKEIEVITKDGNLYDGILVSGVNQNVKPQEVYNYQERSYKRESAIHYSYGNFVIAENTEKGPISIVQLEDNVKVIRLPSLPDELITKPALAWEIVSEETGVHQCQIHYLTNGIHWYADYTALINADDTELDLGTWVTIDNRSGATYKDARIKLMAGDVAQLDRYRSSRGFVYPYGESEEKISEETRGIFEYHLYSLGELTTLKDNQTKQVKLLRVENVSMEKFYVYDGVKFSGRYDDYNNRHKGNYGIQSNKTVIVYLEFSNNKKNGLGMPLPRGRMRMYKLDEDNSLEFIGEDRIDHTPANELVRVRVGSAFDLVGERKQTEFEAIERNHIYDESFEIVLRNHKGEDVTIRVVEHLYRWSNWKIMMNSDPFIQTDSKTIEFRVNVASEEEKKVNYSVRYSW